MEEFKSYIWIIGLIITFVISMIKRRKDASAENRDGEKETKKGLFEAIKSQFEELNDRKEVVKTAVNIVPKETNVTRIQNSAFSNSKGQSQASYSKASERVIKHTKLAGKTQIDAIDDDVMSDFDIRKAVIYSEILNPKFND